ncbi:MAG: type VI secretion system lipoprotein TssJ [Proteobacteria bacterium]|nr:type VI secretion system lipoprotein TssJ [Pseudomonadota bacterium]
MLVILIGLIMVAGPGCGLFSKKSPATTEAGKMAAKDVAEKVTEQASEALPKTPPPKDLDPGPAKFDFQAGGIELRIQADGLLNMYEQNSHTLVLCVYQLKSPNAFNDLAKNQAGLVKLMGCTKIGDSVTSVQRLILQPSELRTVTMDRAEGTQYVGVVAGYYSLAPDKVTKLYQIPVLANTRGLLFKDRYNWPVKLSVDLTLGPQEIIESGGNK